MASTVKLDGDFDVICLALCDLRRYRQADCAGRFALLERGAASLVDADASMQAELDNAARSVFAILILPLARFTARFRQGAKRPIHAGGVVLHLRGGKRNPNGQTLPQIDGRTVWGLVAMPLRQQLRLRAGAKRRSVAPAAQL